MENISLDNTLKIETPIEKTVRSIARSALSIIATCMLLVCSVVLDVLSLNNHIATALLILNTVAICVSAGIKKIAFRKAIALTNFIVFSVITANNVLHVLFPNSNFVIYQKGGFTLALLPGANFLGSDSTSQFTLSALLAVYFLFRLITDSHLTVALIKNLPIRGMHILSGIFMCILSVASVGAGISAYFSRATKCIISPDHTVYFIMYTLCAVCGVLAVSFLLEAIVCFKNFSKLRKIENAF